MDYKKLDYLNRLEKDIRNLQEKASKIEKLRQSIHNNSGDNITVGLSNASCELEKAIILNCLSQQLSKTSKKLEEKRKMFNEL